MSYYSIYPPGTRHGSAVSTEMTSKHSEAASAGSALIRSSVCRQAPSATNPRRRIQCMRASSIIRSPGFHIQQASKPGIQARHSVALSYQNPPNPTKPLFRSLPPIAGVILPDPSTPLPTRLRVQSAFPPCPRCAMGSHSAMRLASSGSLSSPMKVQASSKSS